MSSKLSAILIMVLAISGLVAQYPYWTNYYNTSRIKEFCMDDDYFWCLSYSPFKVNRATGQVTRLSHADYGLPGGLIDDIDIDSEGNIWMLPSPGGLLKWDGQTQTLYSAEYMTNYCRDLVISSPELIWFTKYSGMVVEFDGTGFSYLGGGFENSNPRLDNNGDLWFWADHAIDLNFYHSLVHYDGSEFHYTWVAPENNLDYLYAAFDVNNQPWAGTRQNGVGKWINNQWVMYKTNNSGLLHNEVRCLEFDSANTLWMGTPAGISTLNGSTWGSYTPANSALGNRIPNRVLVEDGNRIWFATDNGLVKIENGELSVIDTSLDGIPFSIAFEQVEAPNGEMWVAFGSGLYKFDGCSWIAPSLPVPEFEVTGVAVDRLGVVWVSGNAGLLRWEGGVWTHYNSQNSGLPSNVCNSTAVDSQRRVWVATNAGLACFDDQSWQSWNSSNAPFPDSEVGVLKIDPQGRIWVTNNDFSDYYNEWGWGAAAVWDGLAWSYVDVPYYGDGTEFILDMDFYGNRACFTTLGGLIFLEDELWRFDNLSSASPNLYGNIVCSAYDAVGNLWLAANGLGRYDGNSWSAYRSSNSGLPSNQCYNVFIDSSGLVWVSTDSSGMNVFNYPASVANADPVVPVTNTLKAWPNPFSYTLSLELELPRGSNTELSVYNLRGQKVRGLALGISNDGKGLASWDGRDDDGADCPAGIYLIRAGRGAGARAVKVLKL